MRRRVWDISNSTSNRIEINIVIVLGIGIVIAVVIEIIAIEIVGITGKIGMIAIIIKTYRASGESCLLFVGEGLEDLKYRRDLG